LSFKDLRIMVVDDSPHMHTILRAVLKGFGCDDVIEARGADQAFQMMREYKPHIAIVDIWLGDLDGIEFTKLTRTADDSPNPYIPIIICSAHAERSRIIAARNAGAMEFVAKPVSPKALYDRLVHVIEKPRRFIKVANYFGPCRRRRFTDEYEGPLRRDEDENDEGRADSAA
jgi:DNA-binding response OmpR family regulator